MNGTAPKLIALIALVVSLAASAQMAAGESAYHIAATDHVGGAGGWDYLTVDSDHGLLYVPRSTHTMVLKAKDGSIVADIPGQKRNHGVALVPSAGHGFISDGEDASVTVFDLKSNQVLGKVKAQDDADGIIYDEATHKVLLVCGDAGVLIPISADVDPKNGAADSAIDLGGKPEFLAADGRGKAYVNLENKAQVAVVDIKAGKVLAHWPTAPGGTPVGMAIDPEHRHLFIGCRQPQLMIVMDCDHGEILAKLPIGRGVDAVVFDAGYAIASCGDGTITVVGESSPGDFRVIQTVVTKPGARTEGLDTKTHTVFLPTAEMEAPDDKGRPRPKPGSFMVLKVVRTEKAT